MRKRAQHEEGKNTTIASHRTAACSLSLHASASPANMIVAANAKLQPTMAKGFAFALHSMPTGGRVFTLMKRTR
jgi:hypothetical protein